MTNWQPEAYQCLLQKDYSQVISIYEQLITDESEIISHYFYLGLVQLLQGQEAEAQLTWMGCIADNLSIEQIDNLTSELVEILYTEVLRQKDIQEYTTAWLISQHIHEIDPQHLDNSLMSVWLSMELHTLDSENDIFLEVIESLQEISDNTESINFDLDLLSMVLERLLQYKPYPLLIELTEICFPFSKKDPEHFIYRLINAAINLAHLSGMDNLAINLLNLCLKKSINCVQTHLISIEILENLSSIFIRIGKYQEALESARKCYELSAGFSYSFYYNYLVLKALFLQGNQWPEILSLFKLQQSLLKNISISSGNSLQLSPAIINRLYVSNYCSPYIQDQPKINHKLQSEIAQLCQINTPVNLQEQMQKFRSRDHAHKQKFKIGYVSHCMAGHSVGWLARWLIQHHDRSQFEIYGYFLGYRQYHDNLQSWYESQMDHVFRALDYDFQLIANKIEQDQIDILIDLDSYTVAMSCSVMARKPAPIQISWLGCDASGVPAIDYFIADEYVLPADAQDYYTEKIWRLPNSYIAVDGFEVDVPSLRRDQLNIPNDAVVYMSSQTAFKRNPDNVRLQMQIIKSVPNSYFLIKGFGDQESLQEFFTQMAFAEGVNPDRLRFLPIAPTEAVHRANIAIADIVLDTYPYNGATTTLETLWMGIPIVTRVGEQFVARNSYTMMVNVGISEGIAWNDQEYLDWGIKLGTNAILRQDIAYRLKQSRQSSPLWNGEQFTRNMESAFKQMWNNYLELDLQQDGL